MEATVTTAAGLSRTARDLHAVQENHLEKVHPDYAAGVRAALAKKAKVAK